MTIDLVCHYWRNDPSKPFRVELHDFPLRHLMTDAAEAYRVYELMAVQRPGDVFKYLWVELLDVPDHVHVSISWRKEKWEGGKSHKWPDKWVPLTLFDRCFYWAWDDTTPESRCWLTCREGPLFREVADKLFAEVRDAQQRLRQASDLLIQTELARIDQRCHPLDYETALPLELTRADYQSPAQPKYSPAFYEKLRELLARPEVNSFTMIGYDHQAARLACGQQRLRSSADPMTRARAWPISISDDFAPSVSNWNGQANVFSEGAGFGYLYVGARIIRGGLVDCFFRWALCEIDEGELPGYRRTTGEGWCLYEDLSSDAEFATKSQFRRRMIKDSWGIDL